MIRHLSARLSISRKVNQLPAIHNLRSMSSGNEARIARGFAPLSSQSSGGEAPKLQGIVFDVDGTLCEPQNYMFKDMRAALGIPRSVDILEHVYGLPGREQEEAMAKVKAIESEAMAKQKPQPGLIELMDYLDSRGIRKALCTRNFDVPIEHLLTTFLPRHQFSPVVTRRFRPPKPDPAGILHIASEWNVAPNDGLIDMIMVGDSVDDTVAGRRAGAATVLLGNIENDDIWLDKNTDLVIHRLDELIPILEQGFRSRPGE